MIKKIYYLSSCSTCQRIISELEIEDDFEMKDIKQKNIMAKELDAMAKYAGSYAALFSKRAMKYRGLGLHEQTLSEKDMRQWILDEYTFLKRPVVQIGDDFFIGNTKKVVAAAKERLHG